MSGQRELVGGLGLWGFRLRIGSFKASMRGPFRGFGVQGF